MKHEASLDAAASRFASRTIQSGEQVLLLAQSAKPPAQTGNADLETALESAGGLRVLEGGAVLQLLPIQQNAIPF